LAQGNVVYDNPVPFTDAIYSDESTFTTYKVNNTGDYVLSSCSILFIGELFGQGFVSSVWTNTTININESQNVTVTFTNPTVSEWQDRMDIRCVADVNGGVDSIDGVLNMPLFTVVSSTRPSTPPSSSGSGGTTIIQQVVNLTGLGSNENAFDLQTGFGTSNYQLTMVSGEERILKLVVKNNLESTPLVVDLNCIGEDCNLVVLDNLSVSVDGAQSKELFFTLTIPSDVEFGDTFDFGILGTTEVNNLEFQDLVQTDVLVSQSGFLRIWLTKFVSSYDVGFPLPKIFIFILVGIIFASIVRFGLPEFKSVKKETLTFLAFIIFLFLASFFDNIIIMMFTT